MIKGLFKAFMFVLCLFTPPVGWLVLYLKMK